MMLQRQLTIVVDGGHRPGHDRGWLSPMRGSLRLALILSFVLAGAMPAQGASAQLDSIRPDSRLLSRALKARPEDLAIGFLLESYSLILAQAAASGVEVHTTLDGHLQTIDKANAGQFVALYQVRIKTYDVALRQRGAPTIAGTYHTTVSAPCTRLGLSNGETTITQHDFRVEFINDSITHTAVAVDSALVVEHAEDPEMHFVGRVAAEHIVLQDKESKCVLTLTRAS